MTVVAENVLAVVGEAYAPLYAVTDDLDAMRRAMDTVQAEPPADTAVTEGAVGGVPGRWVAAPGVGQGVVLFLHGGGFSLGSSYGYRSLAARISAVTSSRVFVADYALAPEKPFPAGYEDAVAAYRGLIDDEAVDPQDIVLMGDSAGAALALSALIGLRDAGIAMPGAYVGIAPFADLTLSGASFSRFEDDPVTGGPELMSQMAAMYAAGTDLADWRVSPLFGDLAGLPPVLLQVASCERLLDDSVRLAEKIRASGGQVDLQVFYEAVHIFQLFFDRLPQAAQAVDQIGTFVDRHRRQLTIPAQ
jgi:monoterpene epsilon-lactone hydrolase